MKNLKQDIVFIDPPWGGTDYYLESISNIYLGNIDIIDIINKLKNQTKIIALKIPYNYNITNLQNKSLFENIIIYKIQNFILLILY